MHLGPPRIVRFSRLRKRLDDPPAILKRDPRRIRIPQIDHPRQCIRLRHARHKLYLMERRHPLRVLLLPITHTHTGTGVPLALPGPHHRHLAPRAHVRREQRQVLEQHALLAPAQTKRQRRRDAHVGFVGGQGYALCWRVVRELVGAHEHLCEIAGGPLGSGLLLVAPDGAEDDVGLRRCGLFLEFVALCEVL